VLVLFRVSLIIFFLIVLIKLRLNLAIALIIDAIVAGILFRLQPLVLLKTFPITLTQITTLEFLLIIYMVLLLDILLTETGNLTSVIHSLEKIFKDYRAGIAVMPALIGLLPMPAGAMVSAPIVKEFGNKTNLSPDRMTFINYWFRHLWEYFWPLYPGILLTAGLFHISVRDIMIAQFPLSLFAIAAGVFFMLGLPKINNNGRTEIHHAWRLVFYMWPIILIIVLVLLAKLRMSFSLGIGVLGAILFSRKDIKNLLNMFARAFSPSTLGVIYTVFLFKNIIETSGALKAIPEISGGSLLLQILMLISAPFTVGFLTGVNSAFVGITFPVIAPLIGSGDIKLHYIMFAYASGFVGVLLSPVHLCLSMTKEYYGAELSKVYRYLLPSVIFVFVGAVIIFILRGF